MMIIMMRIKKPFLICILCSISVLALSQDDDFGLWLGVEAEHGILKKMDLEFSGSLRTFNNSSQIEESFIEGGLKYKLSTVFSLSGSYRLTGKIEDDSEYYFRHKLLLNLKATIPSGNFAFSARARLQRTNLTYIEDDEDLLPYYYGRLKLKAIYEMPAFPLNPYLSCESFSPVFSGTDAEIDRYRLSAGTELKISANNSVEIEYIFQRDYEPHISNDHIISLNYKIRF